MRVLGAVLLRAFGPVGRMAERNALRNPRRTGATGAALMIGLALVACLSVVGSSMVASATDELDKSVGTDFIIQSDNGQLVIPQAVKAVQVDAGPVAHVTEYKDGEGRLTTPDGKTLKDTDITAADPTYATRTCARKTVAGNLEDAYGPTRCRSAREVRQGRTASTSATKINVAFKDGADREADGRAPSPATTVVIDQGAKYTSIATHAEVRRRPTRCRSNS